MATKKALPMLVALLIPFCTLAQEKPTPSTGKLEVLRGRIVAEVASTAFGAGIGPKWITYVFAAEGMDANVFPVRIAYAFYKTDQLPPNSFSDYTTLYELDVRRDPQCDTTVQTISYEKAVNEKGQQLPPVKVLQPSKNAPSGLLKPETTLPCYVLWHGQYKRIDSTPAP